MNTWRGNGEKDGRKGQRKAIGIHADGDKVKK